MPKKIGGIVYLKLGLKWGVLFLSFERTQPKHFFHFYCIFYGNFSKKIPNVTKTSAQGLKGGGGLPSQIYGMDWGGVAT